MEDSKPVTRTDLYVFRSASYGNNYVGTVFAEGSVDCEAFSRDINFIYRTLLEDLVAKKFRGEVVVHLGAPSRFKGKRGNSKLSNEEHGKLVSLINSYIETGFLKNNDVTISIAR